MNSDRMIVEIEGAEELQAKIKALEGNIAKNIFRRNLRRTLRTMLTATRNAAPVKTGLLRRNIYIKAGRHSPTSVGVIIGVKRDAYYKHMIHDGHDVLSLKEKGKGSKEALKRRRQWYFANKDNVTYRGITQTRPRPFIRDPFEQQKQQAAEQIKTGIWKDIESVWLSKQPTFFSEGYM